MCRSRNSDNDGHADVLKILHPEDEDVEQLNESQPSSRPSSRGKNGTKSPGKQVNFGEQFQSSMSFEDGPSRPSSRGDGRPPSRSSRPSSGGSTPALKSKASAENSPTPTKRTFHALPPTLGITRQYSLLNSGNNNDDQNRGLGTIKTNVAQNLFRPPFCLIQIHREKLKMRPLQGSRRLLKCYVRVCGLMASCNQAKLAAESQMLNMSIKIRGPGDEIQASRCQPLNWSRFNGFSTMPLQNTDHFLVYCRGSPIEYTSFTPPLGADLLESPFPSACKPTGQLFACLSVYRIVAPRPKAVLYGEKDLLENEAAMSSTDDPLIKPLLLQEMSCIGEAMASTASRLDALRFAFNLVETAELAAAKTVSGGNGSAEPKSSSSRWSSAPDMKGKSSMPKNSQSSTNSEQLQQRLIVVPMYVWLHISEDTFQYYDHAEFTTDEINNDARFLGIMRNRAVPRQDMIISLSELEAANVATRGGNTKMKSVADELKNAIANVGQVLSDGAAKMNHGLDQNEKSGKNTIPSLNRTLSTNILGQEKAKRALFSSVDLRLKELGNEVSVFSAAVGMHSVNKLSNPTRTKSIEKNSGPMSQSLEVKIQALRDNIAVRKKVLNLNDELCKIETKLHREAAREKIPAAKLTIEHKSVVTYDPDGLNEEEQNYLTTPLIRSELVNTQKRLVEKRIEILDALSGLPKHKFYTEAGEVTKHSNPRLGGNRIGSVDSTSSHSRRSQDASSVVRKGSEGSVKSMQSHYSHQNRSKHAGVPVAINIKLTAMQSLSTIKSK